MTTNYTGSNGGSLPNNITGPTAGEYVTAASVGLVAQGAANQDKFLYDIITRVAYADAVRGFNGRITAGEARTVVGDPGVLKTIGLPGSGVDFEGTRFDLSGTPATNRVVKVDSTGLVPVDREIIQVFISAMGSGLTYEFRRLSGTSICSVYGFDQNDVGAWLELEYVTGTGWRLGRNSGAAYSPDGAAAGTPRSSGVVPGAGA